MALPCLCAGAGYLCSQREQNLCQVTIVVLFCLKGTVLKLASWQEPTSRSSHTRCISLPRPSCTTPFGSMPQSLARLSITSGTHLTLHHLWEVHCLERP